MTAKVHVHMHVFDLAKSRQDGAGGSFHTLDTSLSSLAESYLTRPLFRQIVVRIERLPWHPT